MGCDENGHGSPKGPASSSEPASEQRVFLDSVRLDGRENSLRSPHGTGRINCFAMLLLLGAPLREPVRQLLEAVASRPVERRASLLVSASPVADGAVLRVAGEQVEAVEAEVQRHLGFLGGILRRLALVALMVS